MPRTAGCPTLYPLRETASARYAERTRLNVRDADATLILTRGDPSGGTALTLALARQLRRPHLVVDLHRDAATAPVRAWLLEHRVRVLNVAGPRESSAPGIQTEAAEFLGRLLRPSTERSGDRDQCDDRLDQLARLHLLRRRRGR